MITYIKVPIFYTIYKGKKRYDLEGMRENFEEKLKSLPKKHICDRANANYINCHDDMIKQKPFIGWTHKLCAECGIILGESDETMMEAGTDAEFEKVSK